MNAIRTKQAINAALVGVALALAVLVLATRSRVSTTEQETRETNLLQAYREGEITRVRVERKEGSFTVTRSIAADGGEDPTWSLVEPTKEEADPFAVQKLLGTLDFGSAIRRIKPEEVNRQAFGLDDPSWVIHVDMGGVKYRLRVGAVAAAPAGARYVEIAGEGAPGKGVAIASKNLVTELDVKLEDFRERYVMPYLSSVLSKLVIEGEGGTRKLRRGEWKEGFRFDGMLGDRRLGRDALNRMLLQFARTRAETFIDPAAAEAAQKGAPIITITMTPENPKEPVGVVSVGGACPGNDAEVVALRQKPDRLAACVSRSVLGGLTTPAEALLDRSLFWLRPDEVEGFEVKRGEARLALDRKDTGFVMRAPREGTVDAEAGNGRLEAILRATGVLLENPDRKALGLDPPSGQVTIRSNDSKAGEEIVFVGAARYDGKLVVERKHDGAVVELGQEAARNLVADAVLVRSRSLLDVPIADVARVEIDGPLHQVLERSESGGMTLAAPAGFTVDGTLALELCDALRTLGADRWVTDRNDGTYGIEQPSLVARLVLRREGGAATHVLRLGRPSQSGYFATLDDDPAVFVVPRRLRETLTTWVVDRSVFALGEEAHIVTLRTRDRTVVLEKRGEDFVETDDGEPLPPENILRVVDTLRGIRAEAAVSLGQPPPEAGLENPVLEVTVQAVAGHVEAARAVTRYRFGSGDSWRGISVNYARLDTIPATYAVARSTVQDLIDAL